MFCGYEISYQFHHLCALMLCDTFNICIYECYGLDEHSQTAVDKSYFNQKAKLFIAAFQVRIIV